MHLKWTFWDVQGHFRRHFDEFGALRPSHFRPFSPVIGSLKKRVTDPRTNRQMDRPSYRDAWTHLKSVMSVGPLGKVLCQFWLVTLRKKIPDGPKNRQTVKSGCELLAICNIGQDQRIGPEFYYEVLIRLGLSLINCCQSICMLLLDASTHLYKMVCPSVGPSVRHAFF